MSASGRSRVERLVKFLGWVAVAAIAFVLLDFSFDWRPARIDTSYRFEMPPLEYDRPRILRQDNLSILVIRRSAESIDRLTRDVGQLQDARSRASRQPEYAQNPRRSRHAGYFVGYGIGTDLGCPLQVIDEFLLGEVCGTARYDFAGRAIRGEREFQNLVIPDYNFSPEFQYLTVRP